MNYLAIKDTIEISGNGIFGTDVSDVATSVPDFNGYSYDYSIKKENVFVWKKSVPKYSGIPECYLCSLFSDGSKEKYS